MNNNVRVGQYQIVEARMSRQRRGAQVVLTGRLRNLQAAGTITGIVALLQWTGSGDAPPRNPVNDWASTSYTAGNFFKSASTTVLGTQSFSIAAGQETRSAAHDRCGWIGVAAT